MIYMKLKWKIVKSYKVKIWFSIEKDKDGYPRSKNWEELLAYPVLEDEDYFCIESIPFFLKNISRGDIVKGKVTRNAQIHEGEIFEFERIIDRGGHNTYRLLLRNKRFDDPQFTESELLARGLAVEEQYGDFFAIDVPPEVDQQAIDGYLVNESESGRWEMEDGYLHSIRTTSPDKK